MSKAYEKSDRVEWSWGGGSASGKIETVHTRKITKTIKGTEVTREASDEEPAYTIVQGDGDRVLKSHSEIKRQ